MKKLYSLIRACMTSDMSLFKIKSKNKKSSVLPIFIALYLMFMIGVVSYQLFEDLAKVNLAYLVLSLGVFGVSFMTVLEGVYKSGPLIFNCKDDQLLLSLPIKRRTVLFIRVFKFYVFELLYNSLFLLPLMVVYVWFGNVTWTYYLTCIFMILLLPIMPIVISSIIGIITSSLSSRFKYKNFTQIVISMVFILVVFYFSFNSEGLHGYIVKNASSISDMVTRIYYPAGIFAKLATNFSFKDLIIFILINISLFVLMIFLLGKVYFKINSRLKNVSTNSKKVKSDNVSYKSNSQTISLIKKEVNTFFNTPVFIINAGFALVLFLIAVIFAVIKFDSIITFLCDAENGFGINKPLLLSNIPMLVFALISLASFMTSITNSVISLEGRNINILKSLPIDTKTILLSKVYSALVITTPVLLIGNIILFIKFKIDIIACILLLVLSILMPLVSHFIGVIINLKYPRLDWDSPTEVVKQSTSSFIAVTLGMIVFVIMIALSFGLLGKINSSLLLLILTIVFIIIDILLYLYLTKKSINDFNKLNV